MPTYEMVLLLQKMDKGGLKKVLKRSAEYIFEVGGTIRKMENLGLMNIPFKINTKGKSHTSAHYFIMEYDSGSDQSALKDMFQRDLDVVRATSFVRNHRVEDSYAQQPKPECTLHLDLLPPPYRPVVKAIESTGKKPWKFRFNTGLDYSPF